VHSVQYLQRRVHDVRSPAVEERDGGVMSVDGVEHMLSEQQVFIRAAGVIC
jgi:hypothetical protein